VKHYVVRTLGCKANLYDSQLIEAELQKQGWLPLPASGSGLSPDLCIVNSCTVTDEADRQSRKMASRLGRENPGARVVVTGCGAEVDPERLARSKGIHYVVGNQDKPKMVELILEKLEMERLQINDALPEQGEILGAVSGYAEMISRHPIDREWPLPRESFVLPPSNPAGFEGHASKTRAFIKIQEGCNAFCTYCVIPYGRGPSRSLRPREVIEHVRTLSDQGTQEIVVTGTNIGDYGVDWDEDPNIALASLFRGMLGQSRLHRLRVGSLDPTEVTPALLELVGSDSRFCPHFHVSLQAAHSKILRLMKRKYGLEQVRETLSRISARVPAARLPGGTFVGMDVITGFPGESLEDFEQSVEELKRLPWSRLHVFPYSERSGTPATRLPGVVPQAERLRRSRELNRLSLERVTAHYQHALSESRTQSHPDGLIRGVLLERPMERGPRELPAGQVWANGYTANYLRVLIPLERERAESLRNQAIDAVPATVLQDAAAGEAMFIARLAE
jgi:threonylcarbamoyladenosine tRNA methylthiotransferase MtaB